MKHPRAANFVWNCSNGKYLYWFHNHGGRFIADLPAGKEPGRSPYDDRNPAWIMAGREVVTPQGRQIEWTQPKIVLYDDDPYIRMSYPDLLEDHGKFYITETQKNLARVHEIPSALLDGLFRQWDNRSVSTNGLILDLPARTPLPRETAMPRLPDFAQRDAQRADFGRKDLRRGLSLDLWLRLDSLAPGQKLLDNREASGKGFCLATTDGGMLRLILNDGRQESSWPADSGLFQTGRVHHVVVTVDGGPKIITRVVDGILCDGGGERQFGWGRFSPTLREVNGGAKFRIAPAVQSLRIYQRALRTSEAVAHFRHGTS